MEARKLAFGLLGFLAILALLKVPSLTGAAVRSSSGGIGAAGIFGLAVIGLAFYLAYRQTK